MEALERFVPVELVTDDGSERARGYERLLRERFKTDTRPLYVILAADGRTEIARAGGVQTVESFLEFLRPAK